MLKRPVFLGLAAVAVLWTWQFLTVRYNYGGNWTGLFCIRDTMPRPPFLKSENLYLFHHSEGYDGQVFHLIAHDPWRLHGADAAIAESAFRYQRIVVPALAWMLALGQDRWIHAAYFTVILGFVFLGVYWSSRFARRVGLAPAWGLIFAVTPAALTSIDRMTADVALAAMAAGFAVYAGTRADWRVLALLACASLTRETAATIIAGYGLFLLARRQWRDAALAGATALPGLAWFVYLSGSRGPEVERYVDWVPLAGFADRWIRPTHYSISAAQNLVTQGLDYVSLAGVAVALGIAAWAAWRREWGAVAAAMYVTALSIVFLKSRSVWEEAYAYGRVLTPFMMLTMMHVWLRHPWIAVLPIVLVDARLSLNFAGQAGGVLRGITGLTPALVK